MHVPFPAVVMIFAGYMGAVSVVTTVKWFWFLIGIAVFVPVLYTSQQLPSFLTLP